MAQKEFDSGAVTDARDSLNPNAKVYLTFHDKEWHLGPQRCFSNGVWSCSCASDDSSGGGGLRAFANHLHDGASPRAVFGPLV